MKSICYQNLTKFLSLYISTRLQHTNYNRSLGRTCENMCLQIKNRKFNNMVLHVIKVNSYLIGVKFYQSIPFLLIFLFLERRIIQKLRFQITSQLILNKFLFGLRQRSPKNSTGLTHYCGIRLQGHVCDSEWVS